MVYRIVKWAMAAVAVLSLLAVSLIPALAGVRSDFFAWLLYGLYLLITVMAWGIGGKANRKVSQGADKDALDTETNLTQDALRSRSYWSQM